jgi:alkylation response protein AidB-like acyl-CoA dehydrogenase
VDGTDVRVVRDPALAVLRDEVRAWVEEFIVAEAKRIDADDVYPLRIVQDGAARGFTSLGLPAEFGGGGRGLTECSVMFEEIGRASPGVGISFITIFQAQTMLRLFGNERLQREFLPRFSQGLITSYALTEAAHGSDITSLTTKAVRTADGWLLDGAKAFITSSEAAEVLIILAETPEGVSVFLLERERPGVTLYVGERSQTIGLRNGPHMDMRLESVQLPDYYLVGVEGKGVRQAVTVLNHSRTLAAAISVGIAESAFRDAVEWVMNRRAFGQALFEFQGLQWKLADMRTKIDAARLLVRQAAALHDSGAKGIGESSMAKLFAAESATACALDAVQMGGAYGVSENAPFGRYLRDAKAYEIGGGSSEILRNTIAKEIKKDYQGTA